MSNAKLNVCLIPICSGKYKVSYSKYGEFLFHGVKDHVLCCCYNDNSHTEREENRLDETLARESQTN